MAHINPWNGFNSHSATQKAQLQQLNSRFRDMAPGISITPPSNFSPNSASQMGDLRHQIKLIDTRMRSGHLR